MIDLLEQFTIHVKQQPHLKPILPVKSVRVCFQSGYHLHFIEISNRDCLVIKDCQSRIDLWIKGDECSIQSIILGKEKLRKLETRSDVKITGKLRDILMVEALFYLTERKLTA